MAQWNPHKRLLNGFSFKVLLEWVMPMDFMESVPESDIEDTSSNESLDAISKGELVAKCLHKIKRLGTAETTYRHLLLLNVRSTHPRWHMHKFHRHRITNEEVMLDDPIDMQAKIVESLREEYRVEVAVQRHEGTYWVLVALAKRPGKKVKTAKVPNLTNVFFVHRANSTAIAVKGMRKSYEYDIFQALQKAFNFDEYEEMNLIDTNLDGIFQMAAEEGRPEVLLRDDEQSSSSVDEVEDATMHIIDLQGIEKKNRKHFGHQHFGRDSPPPLSFASYRIEGPFKGAKTIPSLAQYANKPMTMTMTFRGSDVMRGIRSMIEQGVMETNDHLMCADMRTSGANIHMLRSRTTEHK